jgi:hypothetical protein
MTVLAYVLSYLFIGLLCCVEVTYLDTKYDWSNNSYKDSNDNFLPIVSFLLWPVMIPIILCVLSGFGLSLFVNKLRKLFE